MESFITRPRDQLLESTYNSALLQNEVQEERWKNFKEGHDALILRLLSLREKLTHNVMVPVGKLALMKGKLIHTNEILVSLGDGWFAKKSTAEAVELCSRRIKDCDEMLNKLNKERELLISRKTFALENDLFGSNEVIEPYDEVKELQWREKHRENIRAYKQKEARKKKENKVKDEKDIFELLDVLELQEEEEDELNRLDLDDDDDNNHGLMHEDKDEYDDFDDYSDNDSDDDDNVNDDCGEGDDNLHVNNYDDNQRKIESSTTECKFISNNYEHKSIELNSFNREDKLNNLVNNSEDNKFYDVSSHVKRNDVKNSHKVSFAEEPCCDNKSENSDPVIINFKHSDIQPVLLDLNGDGCLSKETIINSPTDIYKTFVCSSDTPKSILKKSISITQDLKDEFNDESGLDEKEILENIRSKRSETNPQVKIGDVTERSQDPSSLQTVSGRPISRFKAARQANKK